MIFKGKFFLTLLDKSSKWWFNLIVEEGKKLTLHLTLQKKGGQRS